MVICDVMFLGFRRGPVINISEEPSVSSDEEPEPAVRSGHGEVPQLREQTPLKIVGKARSPPSSSKHHRRTVSTPQAGPPRPPRRPDRPLTPEQHAEAVKTVRRHFKQCLLIHDVCIQDMPWAELFQSRGHTEDDDVALTESEFRQVFAQHQVAPSL